MKDQVKALWKRCFNDSDAFVDLYFSLRYKEEINRAIVQKGRVVAALQAIPYPMNCFGKTIPMQYISGACTHPDFRNGGLMSRLLNETHRRMYNDGVALATLIPAEDWLYHYYGRFGYVTCFYSGMLTVSADELSASSAYRVERCAGDEPEVFHYVEQCMGQQRNAVLHTWEDYQVILADLRLAEGSVWIARGADQRIGGVGFCVDKEEIPRLYGLLYDTEAVRDALLRGVLAYMGGELIAYPQFDKSSPLGMARLISVERMLSLYAETHPEERLYACLEGDKAIPENNGYYTVEQGVCRRVQLPDLPYESHTIASLTERIFRDEMLYMNLMLN